MKIVVIDTTIQGPLIGGAQTFLPGLLKGLKEKGHEIHLVSFGNPDPRVLTPITDSVSFLHTNLWNKNQLTEDAVPVFAKWVNELEPDIYLISVSPDIGWLVLPYLKPSIATLTIGHTDAETFYAPARHYHSFLTKTIGVSKEVCEGYISTCHLPGENVHWIPYGVQINTVQPTVENGDVLKMVYVGRLEEPQKRISNLADVAKKLSAKHISYQLTIIGDGPERNKLENYLADEITSGKVIFTGWLGSDEVLHRLRQSAVFVLTSAYEGFCIALVEAMANGCCPVVTNIRSGNKELIQDTENGFINEIGDIQAFADKLTFLKDNRSLLYRMRTEAWKTGKEYGISKMVTNYESCFINAINAAKTSPREMIPGFPVMESCQSKYPLWLRRIKKLIKA